MFVRIISLALVFCIFFEQIGLAQGAGQADISRYFSRAHGRSVDAVFRPVHLRYFSYNPIDDTFQVLIDKGDKFKDVGSPVNRSTGAPVKALNQKLANRHTGLPVNQSTGTPANQLQDEAQALLRYFLIGVTLPNETFWVNLRPDSPDSIIDPLLEQTDLGRVLLEADLFLKQDTASLTSPNTPEGRLYWTRLYKKAEELYGTTPANIPTITRPWIVPGEIIVRETAGTQDAGRMTHDAEEDARRLPDRQAGMTHDAERPDSVIARTSSAARRTKQSNSHPSAYIYKATLKVMLEEDYLKTQDAGRKTQVDANYNFKDERSKALNTYSTELIKELILPKLIKQINTSERYAPLRQAYFSLILSRWFKERFRVQNGSPVHRLTGSPANPLPGSPANSYISRIDSSDLTNLTSKQPWSKDTYYQAYKRSFEQGEYSIQEPVYTPTGQVIRSYVSGGINAMGLHMPVEAPSAERPVMASGETICLYAVVDPEYLVDNTILSLSGTAAGQDLFFGPDSQFPEDNTGWENNPANRHSAGDKDRVILNSAGSPLVKFRPGLSKSRFLPLGKSLFFTAVFLISSFFFPGVAWAHRFITKGVNLFSVPEAWSWVNPAENTLSGIARDILQANGVADPPGFSIAKAVKQIVALNPGIKNPDLIHPGQRIRIPQQYVNEESIGQLTDQAAHSSDAPAIDPQDGLGGTLLPESALRPDPHPDPEWGEKFSLDVWPKITEIFLSPYFWVGVVIIAVALIGYAVYKKRANLVTAERLLGESLLPDDDRWYDNPKENRFNQVLVKKKLGQWKTMLKRDPAGSISEHERLAINNIVYQLIRGMPFTKEIVDENVKPLSKVFQELTRLSLETERRLWLQLNDKVDLSEEQVSSLRMDIAGLQAISRYSIEFEDCANAVYKFQMAFSYKLRKFGFLGRLYTNFVRTLYGLQMKSSDFAKFQMKIRELLLQADAIDPKIYSGRQEMVVNGWQGWFQGLKVDPAFLLYLEKKWKNRGMYGRFGGVCGIIAGSYSFVNLLVTLSLPVTLFGWIGLGAFFLGWISFLLSWIVLRVGQNPFYVQMKARIEAFDALWRHRGLPELGGRLIQERLAQDYINTLETVNRPVVDVAVVMVSGPDENAVIVRRVKETVGQFKELEIPVTVIFTKTQGSALCFSELYDYFYYSREFTRFKSKCSALRNKDVRQMRKAVVFVDGHNQGLDQLLQPLAVAAVHPFTRPICALEYNLLKAISNAGQKNPYDLQGEQTDTLMFLFSNGLAVGSFIPNANITVWGMWTQLDQVLDQQFGLLIPNGVNGSLTAMSEILEKADTDTIVEKLKNDPFYYMVDWNQADRKELLKQDVIASVGGVMISLTPEQATAFADTIVNDIKPLLIENHKLVPHIFIPILRVLNKRKFSTYPGIAAGGDADYFNFDPRTMLDTNDLFRYYFQNQDRIRAFLNDFGYCASHPLGSFYVRMDAGPWQKEKLDLFSRYVQGRIFSQPVSNLRPNLQPQYSSQEQGLVSSSAVGGVDFRGLSYELACDGDYPVSVQAGQESCVDDEWLNISKMVEAKIMPSLQRIYEYLLFCCQNDNWSEEKARRVAYGIAGIFRIQEERVETTSPELYGLMVLLESGASNLKLKVLAGGKAMNLN